VTYKDDVVSIYWHHKPNAPDLAAERQVSVPLAVITDHCLMGLHFRTGRISTYNGLPLERTLSPSIVKVCSCGEVHRGPASSDLFTLG
jgi:hypothetical protein